jgi:hypothetical protein
MSQEELVFKTSLEKRPVRFENEDGSTTRASLIQLSGKKRDHYIQTLRDRHTRATKGTKDGAREVTKIEGLLALLVSECLWHVDSDGRITEPYSVDEIQAFPSSAVEALQDACKKMNGLEDDAVEEAKGNSQENDSSGSE